MVAEQVTRGEPAERKLVTVLFCDLVGSTALGDRLDPEALQAVLGAYFDRMRKLSESFGGIVEKFIGDAVVSVFGIPNVHEDDAERAVRCALAMHDALAGLNDTLRPRFGVELVTRIGINTGVAMASPEALATGDVMNTAARFEQAADPGEILVGRETMMLTREIVAYGTPRAVAVKGKADPQQGWPAEALASKRMRPRSTFVGRHWELESLTASVERAIREVRPQIVAVLGEPGIGKTRLIDEFAARTTGRAAVFRGSCLPYGESSPWMPLVEVVRSEAQISDLDAPDAALRKLRKRLESRHPDDEVPVIEAQLGPLLGALRRTAPSGPELVWALRRYLEGLATDGPTVLVLDNLQWGAQTLIETVLELADTIDNVPIALVCAGRPELRDRISGLLGQERAALVILDVLTEEQSRALVENLREQADATWAGDLAESIAARGQGNPLFLEEIAAMTAEEGAPGGIPHSLQALISARLDLLATEAKRVAQSAACIGDVFWDGAVWAVSGSAEDAGAIATALRMLRTRGFVEEEPSSSFLGSRQFRFHHALIREVAYGSVSKADRYHMHRAAAEWLDDRAGERTEFFAQVAHHFELALELAAVVRPLHPPDDALVEAALASFVRAGHQASALVAHAEAARWYASALRALDASEDDPALRCNLLLSLGDVRQRGGESILARQTFADAAGLAREHEMSSQLARAALGFGGGQTFDIPPFTVDEQLVGLLEEALGMLGEEDSGLRARVLGRLAVALYFSDETERRAQLGRDAVAMATRVGDTGSLAYALSARRFALWGPETLDERLEVATKILELAQSVGDRDLTLIGQRWRIVSLLELGDIAAVKHQVDEYSIVAEELKQPYQLWFAEVFRSMLASLEGRLVEAETLGQRALEMGSSQQGENAVQFFAALLMTIREHQGRLSEMEPAIRAYAEQFPGILAIRAALAMIYALEGRLEETREQFEMAAANDFADLPRDTTWLLSLTMLTHAAAALGDRARAKLLYDLFAPYDTRTIVAGPAIVCHGSAAHYLGVLAATIGRHQDALRHFADAIELHERMGARPYLAHSLRENAALLMESDAHDDHERARQMLDRALAIYSELGMTTWADKTRTLIPAGQQEPGER
jgi:class 3 adenylate cyclase/tetratricopeptide (TPR) repeat protein